MKKFFKVLPFLLILFLVSCWGNQVEPVVDKTNYFHSKYQFPIAIFPTYEYLGEEKMETKGAFRTYHLWKEQSSGKYIMINVLTPKGSIKFPENIQWIDYETAIYTRGRVAAYNRVHSRVEGVINGLDGPLPDCIIAAQEFYIDPDRKEAIYKMLIVPDDTCLEVYEPVVEELNRVANMQ